MNLNGSCVLYSGYNLLKRNRLVCYIILYTVYYSIFIKKYIYYIGLILFNKLADKYINKLFYKMFRVYRKS